MKKIIFSLIIVLGITGCGNKSTQSDIEQYLKENYPNESFKIVSEENIDNIKTSGNCSTDKSGYIIPSQAELLAKLSALTADNWKDQVQRFEKFIKDAKNYLKNALELAKIEDIA